jgi:hypothetical protein
MGGRLTTTVGHDIIKNRSKNPNRKMARLKKKFENLHLREKPAAADKIPRNLVIVYYTYKKFGYSLV